MGLGVGDGLVPPPCRHHRRSTNRPTGPGSSRLTACCRASTRTRFPRAAWPVPALRVPAARAPLALRSVGRLVGHDGGGHDEHAGPVSLFHRQHQRDVLLGGVVAEDRRAHRGLAQHRAAARAEVRRRRECRVVDVVRRPHAVTVAIARGVCPRRRDELHRADGAVPHRVLVEAPVVGVADRRDRAHPVQRHPDDARVRDPVLAEHRTAVPTVVGLDPADTGQQRPRKLAGRVDPGHRLGRTHVGAAGGGRQAVVGERAGGPGAGALRAGTSTVRASSFDLDSSGASYRAARVASAVVRELVVAAAGAELAGGTVAVKPSDALSVRGRTRTAAREQQRVRQGAGPVAALLPVRIPRRPSTVPNLGAEGGRIGRTPK